MSTSLTKRNALLLLCLAVALKNKSSFLEYQLGRDIYFLSTAFVHAIKGFIVTVYQRFARGRPLAPSFSWPWEVRLGTIRSVVLWGQEVFMHDTRYFESVRRIMNSASYPLYWALTTFQFKAKVKHFMVHDIPCDAWSCNQEKLDSFYNDVVTKSLPQSTDKHNVVIYLHGGGYAAGGRYSYSPFMLDLAQRMPDCIFVLVEYGLAPYVQFPVPIHQTAAVVDFLCNSTPHVRFALAGDSAGGGLVASSLLHIREENNALWMDRMVGAVMISPMLSQEHSDIPGMENQQYDIIQPRLAHSTARNYCPIPEIAKHNTLASPVFESDLCTGLPPMLIHYGELEVFADNCVVFAERAAEQGADIEIKGYEGMVHCFQLLAPDRSEADESMQEITSFFHAKFRL